jgi:hypothetical protein
MRDFYLAVKWRLFLSGSWEIVNLRTELSASLQ